MKCTSAISPEPMLVARGFAAVAALFMLVVLAGMGVVLVTVFSAQQRGQAFDVLGMQAYQAARAGIEYGVYQALQSGTCANEALMFAGTTLAPFRTDVSCVATAHNEGGTTVTTYEITATACNRTANSCPPALPDATYVERQLRATVGSNAP